MPQNDRTAEELHEPDPTVVWMVEDNEFFRTTIQSLLAQTDGFDCPFAFSSCEDTIAALASEIPPDVILLDIGLPGMSGIEGIGKIRAISPSTHIIILTVYDDDEKVFNALCMGASGYLLKNSSKEKIVEAISEVREGGAPMNTQIAKKVLAMFNQFAPQKGADYGLTAREKEILQSLVGGRTKKQIADTLFLSFHTVNTHIKNIYSKLQVNSRSGAVTKAFREKLL